MIYQCSTLRYIILCFGICIMAKGQRTSLTISPSIVNKGRSQTLTCKYSGSNALNSITWYANDILEGALKVNGDCSELFWRHKILHNYSCDIREKTFRLTILSVSRSNRTDIWRCTVSFVGVLERENSNNVSPSVNVFITSVAMTLPLSNEVTIQENSTQLLKCTSSGGFPEPIVKWYNTSKTPGDTSDDKEITSLITSSYSNTSDYLIIITSTLTFTASKYDNQIDIYCSAYVSLDQTPVNSTRTAKLNVLYGPDGPPKIQGFAAGATYRVIEDRQGQLTCTIKGGNPLPTLSWTCFKTGVLNNTDADTVSKTARWTAVRGQDRNCTCESSHFSGNASVEIQVLILVQVSSVMLKEGSSPLSGQLQVEIGVSKTLTCDTDTSIPAATIVWYIGTEEKQRSTSNSYTFKPDSSDHYKSAYCKAFNIQPESEAVSSNKTSLTIKGMPSIPRLLYYIGLYGGVNMFIFVGGENDGGRLQTFVIDTKRNGTSKWIEQLRFNETDTSYLQNEESLYRFNIRGLIPGVYSIRVIAGNEIAWIADDIAPMIQFTVIKHEDQEYSKQEQSDDTAAIVGGSLSVVIVGILVTSVFIMRRMTWKKEDKKESENKPGPTYDNLQTQHELQTTYSTLTPETGSKGVSTDKTYENVNSEEHTSPVL